MGTRRQRDALVAWRLRVGAHEQDDPVRELRARGPHLLAVDDEMVAGVDGACLEGGEVPSRRRARRSPGTRPSSAFRMAGRCSPPCSSVPQWMRVGPTRLEGHVPREHGRSAPPALLLVPDERASMSPTPAAPVLLRPRDADPARRVHGLLPGAAALEGLAVGGDPVICGIVPGRDRGEGGWRASRGIPCERPPALARYSKSMAPRPLAYTFRDLSGAKTSVWAFTFSPNAVRFALDDSYRQDGLPAPTASMPAAWWRRSTAIASSGSAEIPSTRSPRGRALPQGQIALPRGPPVQSRAGHPSAAARLTRGWERIGWDEALDLAATKLGQARDRHGSLSVLFHRGNGSFAALKCMVNRFFNLFGGPRRWWAGTARARVITARALAFGDCPIHDPIDLRDHSQPLSHLGRNPAVTNIHMMSVLKEARARGARAIVIDPVPTKFGSLCRPCGAPAPRAPTASSPSGWPRSFSSGGPWTSTAWRRRGARRRLPRPRP